MIAIRKGPKNRGPFTGAEPPTLAPFFIAAPIWVTLVVNKTRTTIKFIKSESTLLRKPTATAIVIIVRPKSIRVVSLTKFRRNKPKTDTTFIQKFGKPTTKSKVVGPKVIDFVASVRVLKKFVVTHSKLGDVFGTRTTKIKPQGPKVLSKATQATKLRARFTRPDIIVIKKFGKPTQAPFFQEIKIILQTIIRPFRDKRVKIKSVLSKPTRASSVVLVVKPQHLKVLLQALTRATIGKRIVTKSKLGKVSGRPTTKTIVRPPKILYFANQQAIKKYKFVPGTMVLGDIPLYFSGAVCAVVITTDALWVSDGLTYHHGLSRPTITMTPCPGGGFDVIITGSLSDMRPDLLSKETITIDGELP